MRNIRALKGAEKVAFWMSVAYTFLYNEHVYRNIFRGFLREIYEGIAYATGMPLPEGELNKKMAMRLLPFIAGGFSYSRPGTWEHLLYAPFSGEAPVWRFEEVEESEPAQSGNTDSRTERILLQKRVFRAA